MQFQIVDFRLQIGKYDEVVEVNIEWKGEANIQRRQTCTPKSQICNRNSYELPISTPVMNTSTPPSPTCSAAVTQGVSM